MTIKFGTDGWRALIARDFTFDNVERVIQAYCDVISSSPPTGERTPIPVGYDRRFLSDEFAKAAASVLAANGLPVSFSQVFCPTPCISWMTKNLKAPGGVMITASHNPFQWNGVKFKEGYGGSASPELTSRVEERANKPAGPVKSLPFAAAVRSGQIKLFDPAADYVRQLRSQLNLALIQKAGWRVAFDPLYGAGSGFLSKVLETPVHEIHGGFNPGFGGLHPEPIEKNLFSLMSLVKKERFDVGLATDGDADRIGAVDEHGRFVNPHQIFALLLKHRIESGHRGDVVKTVSTTRMIDKIAARNNLKVHETPIGFKHICAKFLETTPLMGGEESGGIGFPSHVYERDGLLSGLMLLELMASKKKRLGELLNDLAEEIGPFYFQREDIHLLAEEQKRADEKVQQEGPSQIAGLKVVSVNRLDGLKFVLEGDSWLLLRLSGTEPLLRIYAEAPRPETVQRLVQEGRKFLNLS